MIGEWLCKKGWHSWRPFPEDLDGCRCTQFCNRDCGVRRIANENYLRDGDIVLRDSEIIPVEIVNGPFTEEELKIAKRLEDELSAGERDD